MESFATYNPRFGYQGPHQHPPMMPHNPQLDRSFDGGFNSAGLYANQMVNQPIPTTGGWYHPRLQKSRPFITQINLYCELCGIQCPNEQMYQKHIQSEKHKRHVDPVIYSCDVCSITCTGKEHLDAHLKGTKHAKKLSQSEKVKELRANLPSEQPNSSSSLEPVAWVETLKIEGHYYCKDCSMDLSSELQYQQHINGRKHKNRVLSTKTKIMKTQVHHTTGIPCNFSSFRSCYHADTSSSAQETAEDSPDPKAVLDGENALLDEFNTTDNFEMRLSCLYGIPPPLKIIKASVNAPLPPKRPAISQTQGDSDSDPTHVTDYTNMAMCDHLDCAGKRSFAFYSAWLAFQKQATHQLLEQKRRQREHRRQKKTNSSLTAHETSIDSSSSEHPNGQPVPDALQAPAVDTNNDPSD